MNILSCEEMKQKEKKLLLLYNEGTVKFKLNLQELIQAKNMKNDLFCFKKSNPEINLRIQKLVPLHKRVQSLNLDEEENGLFKVLTYISLLIIYKRRDKSNDYLKEHLKCSLYSDDVELMEIRNHSFNKKMKSDTIKSVIAMFFKEIDYLLQTQIIKKHKIKPGQLIAFALQSNDIVTEGFHLFYRKILATLQVENANNCIKDVNPQEAFQNFIEYFEIDCRTFNKLYLFYEAGIFVAQIQSQTLIFGRYYQNQLFFQQTSDEEQQTITKKKSEIQINLQRKALSKSIEIEKEDVKIFNFLLDNGPNGQSMNQSFADDKSTEAVTPSFSNNEDLKFGKISLTIQNTMNKIKDRIHTLEIHQISSEQQEVSVRNKNTQSISGFVSNKNNEENRFLDLNFDDSFNSNDDNTSPTPMLGFGGNNFLDFEKKEIHSKTIENKLNQNIKQSSNQITTGKTVIFSKKNEQFLQIKQSKQSGIRRKTYQQQNSNRSKNQENPKKSELKTSKNQIEVIDQTKSKISQVNTAENSKKISDEFLLNVKKISMVKCQQNSTYSSCTCHQEKKSRIRLSSKIVEVSINFKEKIQQKLEDFGRSVTIQTISSQLKKYPQVQAAVVDLNQNFPKSISGKSIQKSKGEVRKSKSPVKEQKSKQFLNFLKKDKSELIKKLTEKRIAKNQQTPGEKGVNRFSQHSNNNGQTARNFVKQSMFVGSYHFQNPQKAAHDKLNKIRSTSPHHSIDRNPMSKLNIRGRLKTPPNTLRNQFGSEEARLFKKESKNEGGSKERQNQNLQRVNESNSPKHQINLTNSIFQKHQISIKSPTKSPTCKINQLTANQTQSPTKITIKPYEFYNKR